MAQPARQICPICACDDEVVIYKVDDDWVMTCSSQAHPLFEWRPAAQYNKTLSNRSGIGENLGVYGTLLEYVDNTMAEYGVIEHRFSQVDPSTYKVLVNRYGHTALKSSRYTASAFLGGALGQLWREELVSGVWGPATGYWKYNSQVGAYGAPEADEDGQILSWADFASGTLHADPGTWPALDHAGES